MKISYKVNNINHNIHIKNKIDQSIIGEIQKSKSDKKILLIYDEKINKASIDKIIRLLKNSGCDISAFNFKGKKKNKNEKTLFSLINLMIKKKFTKRSILISFGGGVLGDISALAASLYHRGIIYFYVPSTMTSIIDSCIGGKTGINYKNIINSVGNYYHAKSVFIYLEILNDLPNREYLSGIAEILKCGLIKKNKILNLLQNNINKILNRNPILIKKLIYETLNTKIYFFKDDINENNKRLFLNFGHTFAHSIEMATEKLFKKEILRHGEAVGIGILCEIMISNMRKNKLFLLSEKILKNYNLPTNLNYYNHDVDKQKLVDEIYRGVFLDKKKINKYPRFISLKKIYNPKIKEIEDTGKILEVIKLII